jgi:hypothetical protein
MFASSSTIIYTAVPFLHVLSIEFPAVLLCLSYNLVILSPIALRLQPLNRVSMFHVPILTSFSLPCHTYLVQSTVSEAVIQGFLTVSLFYRYEVFSLVPQPPAWRTRVPLLVWPITLDPSSMRDPVGNICYCWHGS